MNSFYQDIIRINKEVLFAFYFSIALSPARLFGGRGIFLLVKMKNNRHMSAYIRRGVTAFFVFDFFGHILCGSGSSRIKNLSFICGAGRRGGGRCCLRGFSETRRHKDD